MTEEEVQKEVERIIKEKEQVDKNHILYKKESVRKLIKSELEAIKEYEDQLLCLDFFTDEERAVFEEIASDEREHVGLLCALLGKMDPKEEDDFLSGMKELEEILNEELKEEDVNVELDDLEVEDDDLELDDEDLDFEADDEEVVEESEAPEEFVEEKDEEVIEEPEEEDQEEEE